MTAIALTIAGSDSGGGAGIQADLKSFAAQGVYGASALTAITAQNTRGVQAVEVLAPAIIAAQIASVLADLTVGAVKIGMLANAATIEIVADSLAALPAGTPVVLDPVMVATSGDRLIDETAVATLTERLLPRADLLTPNLPEAAALLGEDPAESEEAAVRQGRALLRLGARAVLVKGGHGSGPESTDWLVTPDGVERLVAPRIDTRNTHGTGCTLSSAVAARLARGETLRDAVSNAKRYVTAAIAAGAGLGIGSGSGPLDHFPAGWPAGGRGSSRP